MKKILYIITQSELGGAQKYIYDLAINLRQEHEISVAFGEQGDKGELAQKLKEKNIKYHSISNLRRSISPWSDFLATLEIRGLIKKIKPDIIHLNSSKISILGSLASIGAKSKLIYTAHGWVFNEPLSFPKKLFYIYAEKITALLKDKIICVSEYDKQTAIKKNIAPENKLITIHNGLESIEFYPQEEAREKLTKFMPELKTKKDKIWLGVIGGLYKTKGYEFLIESANALINKHKLPIILIIIGEGEERVRLEKLVDKYNLKHSVFLPGRIYSAKIMKAFDIYTCSSVKEGLSYTIIEAMQASLPIIATHVGGTPELIQDHKTGLLVDPGDSKALTNAIITIINDKDLQIKLAKNAQEKSLQKFKLENMITETKLLY